MRPGSLWIYKIRLARLVNLLAAHLINSNSLLTPRQIDRPPHASLLWKYIQILNCIQDQNNFIVLLLTPEEPTINNNAH